MLPPLKVWADGQQVASTRIVQLEVESRNLYTELINLSVKTYESPDPEGININACYHG